MFRSVYSDELHIIEAQKILRSEHGYATLKAKDNLYKYTDGERTNEIIGRKITATCEDGKDIIVKVLGDGKDIDTIPIGATIRFVNLIGKIYVDNRNRLALSCSAEKAQVVE